MLSKTELLYTLALQRVPKLGDASVKKLIRTVGSAEAVFKERKVNLAQINGIGRFKLNELHETPHLKAAEKELRSIEEANINYWHFLDAHYPAKLKSCIDGPVLLFHSGNIALKEQKILSVVGTRKMTSYGRYFCEQLIEELAPVNPVIVSGFAYGIDITAHKLAINNNLQTVACLAHGFNQIYPKAHKKFIVPMEKNGGFMTEFWSDASFDRTNFLRRNRIIAGLSEATVVIESAEKGGSLVTADIANSYNRDVFAVPGRVGDIQSQGCNNLIKSQQAHLITSAADIIYMLGWAPRKKMVSIQQTQLFVELSPEEKDICNCLRTKDKIHLDTLALQCKLSTSKTATLLLKMELKGIVKPLPGKFFSLR